MTENARRLLHWLEERAELVLNNQPFQRLGGPGCDYEALRELEVSCLIGYRTVTRGRICVPYPLCDAYLFSDLPF